MYWRSLTLKEWNTDQGIDFKEGSIDGYDKLKPFNRRILWLEVASSNNDPKIVAQYYLDCVRQLGATARIILGDRGTEMRSHPDQHPLQHTTQVLHTHRQMHRMFSDLLCIVPIPPVKLRILPSHPDLSTLLILWYRSQTNPRHHTIFRIIGYTPDIPQASNEKNSPAPWWLKKRLSRKYKRKTTYP